ncbi:MAG: hypothetical protein ACM3L5_00875 [Candidatus Saccharibacteria bacterium]
MTERESRRNATGAIRRLTSAVAPAISRMVVAKQTKLTSKEMPRNELPTPMGGTMVK